MIHIRPADFQSRDDKDALVRLLIAYSADEMGGGKALSQDIASKSISLMAEKDQAVSFLAFDGDDAVGFSNCFETVATFAGKTAYNIHDLAVVSSHRGKGIGQALLAAIEAYARDHGAHKITLEVLEGNKPAKHTYEKVGFAPYILDPKVGQALFYQKVL